MTDSAAWLMAEEPYLAGHCAGGYNATTCAKQIHSEEQDVKRLGIIVALLLLLLIGGGLTMQLISNGDAGLLPVLRQTANPDASVADVIPWKAEQFALAIGFILFNLIGMGVTIAVVFWLLDRTIRRSSAGAPPASKTTQPTTAAE